MPGIDARIARSIGGLVLLGGALAGVGCASAGTAPGYQVTTSTAAAPPLAPPTPKPSTIALSDGPPSLSPAQSTIVGTPGTKVSVSSSGGDVAAVLRDVARQAGLSPVIDPTVHGPISVTMHNVALSDAMVRLVGNQYQYRVQNGSLIVSPIQLVQQTYEVSYLQMARSTTASTVVNHNLGGSTNSGIVTNPGGAGTGISSTSSGLVASGTDVIQSSSSSDVWGELKVGLRTILFGGRDTTSRGSPSSTSPIGGSGASGDCTPDGTCLNISPFASLVTVTATPDKQQQVADWLNLFRASITRQVYITAKVVEVSLDRSKSYGIDWSGVLNLARATLAFNTDPTSSVTSTGNASFNLGVGDLALTAVLNALQTTGDVHVLASPATSAMNQQKASFNVTREVPFVTFVNQPNGFNASGQATGFTPVPSVSTAQIGIVLDVLPQISSDNVVTMSIRPSVTSLVSQTTFTAGGSSTTLPTTDRRETDTMARVRSGETVMIGGLIQTQTENQTHGMPILMHLPVIGKLFSHTTQSERHSEMVIFITPQIVSGQPPISR
jgi:MSHA biogenesis protein MshL